MTSAHPPATLDPLGHLTRGRHRDTLNSNLPALPKINLAEEKQGGQPPHVIANGDAPFSYTNFDRWSDD